MQVSPEDLCPVAADAGDLLASADAASNTSTGLQLLSSLHDSHSQPQARSPGAELDLQQAPEAEVFAALSRQRHSGTASGHANSQVALEGAPSTSGLVSSNDRGPDSELLLSPINNTAAAAALSSGPEPQQQRSVDGADNHARPELPDAAPDPPVKAPAAAGSDRPRRIPTALPTPQEFEQPQQLPNLTAIRTEAQAQHHTQGLASHASAYTEDVDEGRKINLAASVDGATVVAANKEARKPDKAIDGDMDSFMKNPCSASKWLIIELSQVRASGPGHPFSAPLVGVGVHVVASPAGWPAPLSCCIPPPPPFPPLTAMTPVPPELSPALTCCALSTPRLSLTPLRMPYPQRP